MILEDEQKRLKKNDHENNKKISNLEKQIKILNNKNNELNL